MTPIIRPGQAAKVQIQDLHTKKVRESLYQEWLKQGNAGSFDDFMAVIAPQTDEAAVRRMVEEVLRGMAPPAASVEISRDTVAQMVRELLPQSAESADIAAKISGLMSVEDFDVSDGIRIKADRAVSKADFDAWKKGVTAGTVAVQTVGQVLVVNDWFTPEMQADVLDASPQMTHSRAIYDILTERAKPGMKIRMFGNFNMAKLEGIEPELFGADGRTPDSPDLAQTVNGCQPTMILHFDNWDVDFSQCRFKVLTMMTDGFAVAGYKGKNRFKPGAWITKTIADHDPDRQSAENWQVLGGKNGVFPPIDGTTGFAEKGYADAGFNSTSRHKWAGNYRSNSLDTRNLKSGGYGGAFPQADGSTADTWGEWKDGGLHGNIGSGGYIFQMPSVGRAERETASITVQDMYARGFITYGIEVGTEAKPDGGVFADTDEVWAYTPQNVWLVHTQVEDCYEGGIQANRFANLWELYSRCYRMGHPDCGFTYHKPGKEPSAFANDPGYGTSSRRKTAQINRYIIGGWYIDCARKGIDAHTISGLYIANVKIKAMIWGIQICFDEIYTTPDEPSPCTALANQFTLRDSEIFSNLKGLDFTNGSFSSGKHVNTAKQRLYEMRFSAYVDNVQIFAPIGVFDNYGRGGCYFNRVTATCHYPYGKPAAFNPAVSRGFWIGSQNPAAYGIPFNVKLENCTVQNSPCGNYAESYCLQPSDLLTMRDCIADITPFVTDTVMPSKYLRGKNVVRSGIKSKAYSVSEIGGRKLTNALFDNCVIADKSDSIAISRFVYQDTAAETPTAPVSGSDRAAEEPSTDTPPSGNLPQVMTFGMANAAANSVRDDDNAVEIIMGGSNPPADWNDMADVSGDIKYIKGRLKNKDSSAGVYPRFKADLDGAAESTVVIPLRINSLGSRAAVVSLGMSAAGNTAGTPAFITEKKADTGNAAIRLNSNYRTFVNGAANTADTRLEYGRWYIVTFRGRLAGEYVNLGTLHGGNGQLDADYGEGLTIYRNHTPLEEDLAKLVSDLKTKYGIT